MAKEELIEMRGSVTEVLPDGRYRVTLENGHNLVAYSGGNMAKARAIRAEYFEHWRELWFATCKADKHKPIEARAPDFDFRAYCSNAQSIAARIAAKPAPVKPREPEPPEPPLTEEEQAQARKAIGDIGRMLAGEKVPA